jgi:hypothetical protein
LIALAGDQGLDCTEGCKIRLCYTPKFRTRCAAVEQFGCLLVRTEPRQEPICAAGLGPIRALLLLKNKTHPVVNERSLVDIGPGLAELWHWSCVKLEEVLPSAEVFEMRYQSNAEDAGNLTEVLRKLACAEQENAHKKNKLSQELGRCIAKIAAIGEAMSPRQASLLFLYQAHAQIIMERLALFPARRDKSLKTP